MYKLTLHRPAMEPVRAAFRCVTNSLPNFLALHSVSFLWVRNSDTAELDPLLRVSSEGLTGGCSQAHTCGCG